MNFYKPILLPSNNIPYNSIINVREPDLSLLLELRTAFLNSSENDLIFSIIKKYTNIEKPEELYYKDIQYLYYFYLTIINKDDEIKVPHICEKCDMQVNLSVNLSEFETKYAKKDDFEFKKIKINDFEFYFRNRLFKDNIITGMINLEFRNNPLENIINFIAPQCVKVFHQGNEFENDSFRDAIIEIGYNEAMNIFNELRSESWGIDSYFYYRCKKCQERSKVFISDPFRSSFYFMRDIETNNFELLETILSISSFKIVSYDELLNTPISLWEPMNKYITKIIKKKYGSKDSVGYLEQFQEELS